MSALVAALLGLLPEAFALFKGKNKEQAAEDFAQAAIGRAKQLLGVDAKCIGEVIEGVQINGDITALIFGKGGPAFVDGRS